MMKILNEQQPGQRLDLGKQTAQPAEAPRGFHDPAHRLKTDLTTIVTEAEKHGTLLRLKSVAIYFDEIELRTIIHALARSSLPLPSPNSTPMERSTGNRKYLREEDCEDNDEGA